MFIAGFTGAISKNFIFFLHLDKWNASERRFKNTYLFIYMYVKKLIFKIFKTYIVQNGDTAVLPLICWLSKLCRACRTQGTIVSGDTAIHEATSAWSFRHPHNRMSKGRIEWSKVLCQDLLTYQRQLPLGVLRKNWSDKVCKIYRVRSAMDEFCSQNFTRLHH